MKVQPAALAIILAASASLIGCVDKEAERRERAESLARDKARADRLLQQGARLISSTKVDGSVVEVVSVPVPGTIEGVPEVRQCIIVHGLSTAIDCSDPEIVLP
ncbi:hypothetical protein SAMN05216201_109108 [Pseudomonas linyingensis]|uniref:Lipoprotein n=1 Tax=Pseudomonas linyingensis TaxID=915471 RepID=A0A1H6Z0Y4_9PSED|nr:hypothetical protein [Pseudomonas linyingensis]SEJ47131.1 hypothetical protein SAMN05216201_109108 [Pseudomonas linyingensis]